MTSESFDRLAIDGGNPVRSEFLHFHRDHRPKTVGRLYDPRTDVEPLHYELPIRASARR